MPRRRDRRGLALGLGLIALLTAAALVAVTLAGREPGGDDASGAAPRPTARAAGADAPAPPVAAPGFLATADELRQVEVRADAGLEPWASARRALLAEAESAAQRQPSPIESLRVEGTEGDFVDDSADAYTLALTYGVTGDPRYAEASARFIRAWSETARSTEDTCRDNGSCTTSLVISRVAPAFVFAAHLIEASGALSAVELATFRSWIRDVLLPAASERMNNWGDAGTFFRIAGTTYLGDVDGFAAAVEKWKEQADLIQADGEIPEETRRGRKGLQYSQEALLYKLGSAKIAERSGVDLWSYTGAGGGGLEVALDLVATSLERPERWEWHDDVEVPTPAPLWELAAAHWGKASYRAVAERRRPYGPGGHSAIRWTTIAGGATSD